MSNHNIAADSGGTTHPLITSESKDAKAENVVDQNNDQSNVSDLTSENSQKDAAPIITNGKSDAAGNNTVSPSQVNHDAQQSPANLISQTTNGTHNTHVAPENGTPKNGVTQVKLNIEDIKNYL